MPDRQRGLSLVAVVIVSGLLALAAMAALFSMRYERNLFAEAWAKVAGSAPAQVLDAARGATAQPVALRKCVIDGKTVVSNTDCKDDNKSSRTIEIHDSHGIEAPKPPVGPEKGEPTSTPAIDRMIEKQLR
ncbi:DUF4124 domain-containing protein [Massilia solisilvae]|uniref:DUF4124 domain-containing protein n=1 Tax=Massilia solisilvae TaxID=1811225 RepID=A0ABT2BDR6_9BURK|nr:DUF4124 domain-containing protein [Massilia solisilvae]MCS0606590.1 DUF4124 domain-containing protein [Massilia solisilvae]